MIEGWIDRFYVRHRRSYFMWWWVLGLLLLQLIAQPFAPLAARAADLNLTEYGKLALILAVLPLLVPLQHRVARATFGRQIWLFVRDEDYDPDKLWSDAIAASRRQALFAGAVATPIVVAAPWLAFDPATRGEKLIPWMVLGLAMSAAVTATWVTGNRFFARPLLEDIARRHPSVVSGGRQAPVHAQLSLSVFSSVLAGALTATGFIVHATGPGQRMLLLTMAIVVAALFASMIFRALNGTPIVQPLRALIEATKSVADGNLETSVTVTSADELGRLGVAFNDLTQGLRERARLQAAFGSYVDPALTDRLLAQRDNLFEGETVEVTVFFLDVRNFTSFTEAHEATDVVARLNRLFGLAVPIIRAHGGHANKFLGDGLMAVFGTPEPHDDHAQRAFDAAVEILDAVQDEFGDDLKIGIGMDTGKVVAGTIGGGGKLEFTLIGDTVNVAARIEEQTKELGTSLLISQGTHAALAAPSTNLAPPAEVVLRGKAIATTLYGRAV